MEGKSVLVTGGAAGIGEAIVRKMAAVGARVLFCDVDEPGGLALAAELRDAGQDVGFHRCDVTDEPAVERLLDDAAELFGGLDAAVNNVGGYGPGDWIDKRVHDTDLAAWNATVAMNLTSCFLSMKHELRVMMPRGAGAIVNIASLAGSRWSEDSCPSYAVSKAGVIRLTEYAAVAYAETGVRINAVSPGFTATKGVVANFTEAERNDLASKQQPMKRALEPVEIAQAVVWACSDQSSGVTGLTIPVDGGWSAT